jgi:hypothetical protein
MQADAHALLKCDPEAFAAIMQTAKEWWASVRA